MITNMILAAIGNNQETEKITACFKSGREITFTSRMLETLKMDPEIAYIYATETGEIIYDNDK